MKIAYVLHWPDLSREDGVLKKIAGHMRAWAREGHLAKLFALSDSDKVWEGMADLSVVIVRRGSILLRLLKTIPKLVRRVMAWKPDMAFLRVGEYYPAFDTMMGAVPTFLEIHSDDAVESRMHHSLRRQFYHLATWGRLLRKARGLMLVSRELPKIFACYGKPMVVIGNGIDLSLYPQLPAPENPAPRFVFLGYPQYPWNGVDKIIQLAERLPRSQFDLVGIGPGDLDAKVPPNVSAHGVLGRAQYERFVAQADIAIGTLALHRKGMNGTSALKVCEYLAYGLPTIIGYEETDFPQQVPFLLQLPNTPDNVLRNVPAIVRFAEAWKGRRVPREQVAHLDVTHKERKRLEFFKSLVRRGSGPA